MGVDGREIVWKWNFSILKSCRKKFLLTVQVQKLFLVFRVLYQLLFYFPFVSNLCKRFKKNFSWKLKLSKKLKKLFETLFLFPVVSNLFSKVS